MIKTATIVMVTMSLTLTEQSTPTTLVQAIALRLQETLQAEFHISLAIRVDGLCGHRRGLRLVGHDSSRIFDRSISDMY